MPPRSRKPRPKRPWQKVQDFVEIYKNVCTTYDVPQLSEIKDIYEPIIAAKGKRLPQILQFADTTVNPLQIRPLIESYKQSEIRIKILSFLNTDSGDEGLKVIGHAFEPPLEIAGLAYHANGVGPSGCRGLARSIVRNTTLAILELDFNPGISDEGVIGLTHYGHCSSLSRLSLKFCDIGDAGAAALGKWIALDDCPVKELYLSGNRIGPAGIISFAEGLANNKSLNRVELQDNVFGYDANALMALYDAISKCPTLQYINMLNNFEISDEIANKYFELVKDKPLGECVLSVKMDPIIFQNMRAFSLINKRKMMKEAKRLAREARRNPKASARPPESDQNQPPTDLSATHLPPSQPNNSTSTPPQLSTTGTIP